AGRPCADGTAVDDPARRAIDGARAADRRGNLRHRARSEPPGGGELPARRAEHECRSALRRLWLHPGKRPGRDGRRGLRAGAERGRQGVLPRAVDGVPEVVSRRQALSPQEALAGIRAMEFTQDWFTSNIPNWTGLL